MARHRNIHENKIDMMGLQETNVRHNSKENRKDYLWLFSGEEKVKNKSKTIKYT